MFKSVLGFFSFPIDQYNTSWSQRERGEYIIYIYIPYNFFNQSTDGSDLLGLVFLGVFLGICGLLKEKM